MAKAIVKHAYLLKEEYYEARSVEKGRSVKICEHCGKSIKIGDPHETHHFYPEFQAYPTHDWCSDDFIKSLN